MKDDPAKVEQDEEAPTRPGGDDVEFELESPSGREGTDADATLPAAPRQGFMSRIFRRRDPNAAAQAGFVEMMGVMHSIKSNLELQSDAQARLLEALEHFPDAVDGLKGIGKMGENQEEMLGLVRKQVEDTAEHSREVAGSINRFDQTLTHMDETSQTTAETMVGVAERSRESEEVLRAMLERSERRLTLLMGAMGILSIVAIGAVLFLSVGRGLDQRSPSVAPAGEPESVESAETPSEPEIGAEETEVSADPAVVVPLDTGPADASADGE